MSLKDPNKLFPTNIWFFSHLSPCMASCGLHMPLSNPWIPCVVTWAAYNGVHVTAGGSRDSIICRWASLWRSDWHGAEWWQNCPVSTYLFSVGTKTFPNNYYFKIVKKSISLRLQECGINSLIYKVHGVRLFIFHIWKPFWFDIFIFSYVSYILILYYNRLRISGVIYSTYIASTVVGRWTTGQQVADQSCMRGVAHTKIHLISPDDPQPSLAQ